MKQGVAYRVLLVALVGLVTVVTGAALVYYEAEPSTFAAMVLWISLGLITIAVCTTAVIRMVQERTSPKRLSAIICTLLGFLTLFAGRAIVFDGQLGSGLPGNSLSLYIALACVFFSIGLVLLCKPQDTLNPTRRRNYIDAVIGVVGLLVLWATLILPRLPTDDWPQYVGTGTEFATASLVVLLAAVSYRRCSIPIVQVVLFQTAVGLVAGGDVVASAWLIESPALNSVTSLTLLAIVGVILTAFLGRRADEKEAPRQLLLRDIWTTVVPLSPVAIATGTLLFSLATGGQVNRVSAATIAVVLLTLITALIWLRTLATVVARRALVAPEVNAFDEATKQGWFQVLTANSREMVLVADADTRIVYASNPLLRLVGMKERDIRGRRLDQVISGLTPAQLLEHVGTARRGTAKPVDASVLDQAGQERDLQFVVAQMTDVGSDGFVLTGTDVTDARRMRQLLGETRRRDGLTGLLNREAFVASVTEVQEWAEPQSLAVMVVDLVDFRSVNDTRGHDIGDTILRRVAELLDNLPAPILAVSRLSGDDFGLLLRDRSPLKAAESISQRIRIGLQSVSLPDGSRITVRAAMGFTTPVVASDPATSLVEQADLAATASGADPHLALVPYEPAMREELLTQLATAESLRASVAAGEFSPHYQPIVDLASGRLWGVEALARRRLADGSWQQPDLFIPLAERIGLVSQIDRCIREKALADIAQINLKHPHIKLSLNLSPAGLSNNLLQDFSDQVADSGVSAGQVVVEITESTVATDPTLGHSMISALHKMGCHVALDDFGTGYSSLAGLADLDCDIIKIDQAFVHRLSTDKQSIPVVRSVVDLARNLGIRTVAEGIGRSEQADILRGLGCDRGQGFLYGAPMDMTALGEYLDSGQTLDLATQRPKPRRRNRK